MSFGITPRFGALEIAFSQSHKHHLQNILYYHKGKLRNYTDNLETDSLEMTEMRRVIAGKMDVENVPEFPCLDQSRISQHVSGTITSFLRKLEEDSETFIDNITISDSTILTPLNLTIDSIEREIQRMMSQDEVLVLKLDVYAALPYDKNVFSGEKDSHHQEFLKNFQHEWGIVRPWRYTSVRHWIYIPRITIYGEEIYDLESVFRYTRNLGREIYSGEISYNYVRRVYAYLKLIKYLNDNNTYPTRFPDQVTLHQIKSPLRRDFDEFFLKLQRFFKEGPVSFVTALLCDLQLCERIQSTHPNINRDFLKQSRQTLEYLLKEHHILCDQHYLETYIANRLGEDGSFPVEMVQEIVRFMDPNIV